jgi:predicted dehydrogenase
VRAHRAGGLVTAPEVGIGLIGYGDMGRAHAYGYRVAPLIRSLPVSPVVRVISGRSSAGVSAAAAAYGISEWVTDWQDVLSRPDVQIVDVCTPPGTHAEIVRAAAEAGKGVVCEKPLAVSLEDAVSAVEAVRRAGVPNAIGFNYRRLPAVSLMRAMISAGRLGRVRLWRATWLSDEFLDPDIPFDWRFDRALGGSTIADLGSHLIDMALWMVGDIASVCAQSETFTPGRGIDEASSALVRFAGGARGTFEMARVCPRRPCDFFVEAGGDRGTLRFEYPRLNELWFGDAAEDPATYGLRRIRAEHPGHPYAADWWPIGQGVGYGASFANQAADHLSRWPDGPWEPDLGQGLRVQAVCAAMERSAAEGGWVSVP